MFATGFQLDFNPIELLGCSLIIQCRKNRSGYFEIRNQLLSEHHDQMVYVSSESYSDLAGADSTVADVGTAFLSGGAAADEILRKYQQRILRECEQIRIWGEAIGLEDPDTLLASALSFLVTHNQDANPSFEFRLLTIPYRYEYSVRDHIGFIPVEAILQIAHVPSSYLKLEGSQKINHFGFAIILKGGRRALNQKEYIKKQISRFNQILSSGPQPFSETLFAVLKEHCTGPARNLLEKIRFAEFASGYCDTRVREELMSRVGFSGLDLEKLVATSTVIDLLDLPIGSRMTDYIKKFALGNEGQSSIDRLELDLSTFELSVDFRLHHKHSWGNIMDVPDVLREVVSEKLRALGIPW